MLFSKLRKKCLKKSEYKNVCDNLNAICKCLNTIYSVNSGGCCYMAYIIAEILNKEGIEYSVILESDNNDLADSFSDIDDSVYHVCIKVTQGDNIYIINEISDSIEGYEYENVSPKELLDYYNKGHWNWTYQVVKNKFIKYVVNLIYDNFSSSLREER